MEAETGDVLVLALCDEGAENLCSPFIFDHFDPIEPVLDMVPGHQEAGMIPLSGRINLPIFSRDQVIQRRQSPIAPHALTGIGMGLIVEKLIFQAERRLGLDEIFNTAVCAGRQTKFEG
jgi:hypothetical protein